MSSRSCRPPVWHHLLIQLSGAPSPVKGFRIRFSPLPIFFLIAGVRENNQFSTSKTLQAKSGKDRATVDSGAAALFMPEGMFPRAKFERDATPKKFVAANGEQIRDLEQKTIPFKTRSVTGCMNFRSASVVRPLISNAQSRPSWNSIGPFEMLDMEE